MNWVLKRARTEYLAHAANGIAFGRDNAQSAIPRQFLTGCSNVSGPAQAKVLRLGTNALFRSSKL